jgi:hypothetical protein
MHVGDVVWVPSYRGFALIVDVYDPESYRVRWLHHSAWTFGTSLQCWYSQIRRATMTFAGPYAAGEGEEIPWRP